MTIIYYSVRSVPSLPDFTSTHGCSMHWCEHTCYHCADATIYVGGLDEKVTEALLWELFLQAGPVGKLHSAIKGLLG